MKQQDKYITIFVTILTTLILLIIAYIFKEKINFDNRIDLLINGAKVILIVIVSMLLSKHKVKHLNLGCLFLSIAWLWNYLSVYIDIIHLTTPFFVYHNVIYHVFRMLGLFFILYGINKSLTSNKALVKELQDLAFYDSLTNLPNRNMILKTCPLEGGDHCSKNHDCSCSYHKNYINLNNKCAFLFLDLDDFKQVNDNMGHFYGDLLLTELSHRLKNLINHDDKIIRLSGDEFLIILYYNNDNDVEQQIKRFIRYISKPFKLVNKEVYVSCSIGVSLYPLHGDNIEILTQKADIAMNEAKKGGKNNYYYYNEELQKNIRNKFEMINDLKNAIRNEEFIVMYQPKAIVSNDEITGLEALIRWNHPKNGLIYPNSFIELAEEMGFIKDIDKIVIKNVCKQIEEWSILGHKPYNVSVNISPKFFNEKTFINDFNQIINKFNIDPSYISVEITEGVALSNINLITDRLFQLKKRNMKVYLDDFGKGYSSLSYIKNLPFDYLKIDKAFIDGILDNQIDITIVKSIIDVSNLKGIRVVAEGVETKEQINILKELGCHEYQGYLLSKPNTLNELYKNILTH